MWYHMNAILVLLYQDEEEIGDPFKVHGLASLVYEILFHTRWKVRAHTNAYLLTSTCTL